MPEINSCKFFFIINLFSGNKKSDWPLIINDYFIPKKIIVEIHLITKTCCAKTIKEKIELFKPNTVIAVGGDGTVKLVTECLIGTTVPLGILPSGSGNGLARELGISDDPYVALDILVKGFTKSVHVIIINKQLCIHLADIGLNAYAMDKFKTQNWRGMWGYLWSYLKVLWQNPVMELELQITDKIIKTKAEMVIIANATKYGTGALINPIGKLDDDLFEVVIVKKISSFEVLKINFLHEKLDADKTEIFQTNDLIIKSTKKVHFQIDGEYLGKVKEVSATIIPNAIQIIVPEQI